jgi:hypothetical protein
VTANRGLLRQQPLNRCSRAGADLSQHLIERADQLGLELGIGHLGHARQGQAHQSACMGITWRLYEILLHVVFSTQNDDYGSRPG